jgi:hypothetical protein
MAESNYANFVAKTAPTGGFSISNGVGSRLLEPILTQTTHFLVPQQRLKSLNHHLQWRVGNFGENYQMLAHVHDAEIESR